MWGQPEGSRQAPSVAGEGTLLTAKRQPARGRNAWRTRLLALAACVLSSLAVAAIWPAPSAHAALHSPIPANALEEPTDEFTDADALFAFMNVDTAGGYVCVVEGAVTDAGAASCNHPAKDWGKKKFILQIGSESYVPIHGPPLPVGEWRLLVEDSNGGTHELSPPFFVEPCPSCSHDIGEAAIQAFKKAAEANQVGTVTSCIGLAAKDIAGKLTSAKGVMEAIHDGATNGAEPGFLGTIIPIGGGLVIDFEIPGEHAAEEKAMDILKNLTCGLSLMYADIVADPVDPNYTSLAQPEFSKTVPVETSVGDAAVQAIDRERAFGLAELTAYQRYLGAKAANNESYVHAQAKATAEFGEHQVDELQAAATALRAFAVELEALPEFSEPVVTQEHRDQLSTVYARVRTEGFTSGELKQLHELGLSDEQIAAIRSHFSIDPAELPVGETLQSVLRTTAQGFEDEIPQYEAFTNEAAAVGNRTNEPPVASFEANPNSGPAPLEVTFHSTSSDPDLDQVKSAEWDFGDGSKATGTDAKHTYSAEGTYTVTLTVSDGLATAQSQKSIRAAVVKAEPTTTTTTLSGASQEGTTITVPESTAVTDKATLAGVNAATATGKVDYKVFSDKECSKEVASAGSATAAGEAVPASSAQTLAPGTYYWQASYSGDEANAPSKSECGSEVETVNPVVHGADLSITKFANAATVAGEPLAYTISVANNGPDEATGVTVTDHLPAGATFLAARSSQGRCSQAAGVVTCSLGALASGNGAEIEIDVAATAEGTLKNTASISSDQTDPNPANNAATATTTVEAPPSGQTDLRVTESDSPDPVLAERSVLYSISVANMGPDTATGVVVTDQLPAGTSLKSAIAEQGSCAETSGKVICDFGRLGNGELRSVAIRIVPASAGTITNNVSVAGGQSDPNSENNSTSETTTVNPGQAPPGKHTQQEVNEAVEKGVAYLDSSQNLGGSYGQAEPTAETGMTLVAYSVLANGSFETLPATYQEHVKAAIAWLLEQQGPTGAFGAFATYDTGIALAGLQPFVGVNSGVAAAIARGRAFLEEEFQGAASTGCSSEDGSPTAYFCGGWNYEPGGFRSDESNTGFALFGLHQSGGVPAAIVAQDLGWQHHIQQISSNPLASGNDGSGCYQPGSFCGGANDTGSMLFGLGYDGVKASDAHVQAGIKFGEDVLNEYELEREINRTMVLHTGREEDGTCEIGTEIGIRESCDWVFESGEGGYHYSLFALTKGFGEFSEARLSDPTNWYAKVVDLLLTQQGSDGSWPPDLRDDAGVVFATALSVSSLGLVGVEQTPTTTTTKLSGGGKEGTTITVPEGTAVTDKASLSGEHAAAATGKVDYKVFSDKECKTPPTAAGSVEVSAGAVPSSEAKTLSAGTYYWRASYSGDTHNKASESSCGSEIEAVEQKPVKAEPITTTTKLSGAGKEAASITVPEGTAVTDKASLSGEHAAAATGKVDYKVFSDKECSKEVASAGSATAAGEAVPASSAQTLAPGTYYWQASYSGDEANAPSKSECGSEVETVEQKPVKAEPTTATTKLSGAGKEAASITVPEGTAVTDKATLAGLNAATATGKVDYKVFSDKECSKEVASAGSATAAGEAVPASSAQTLAPGTYYWQASYSGDEANAPSKSECGSEVETVERHAETVTATCGKTSVGKTADALAANVKRVNRCSLPGSAIVTELAIYLAPTSTRGEQLIKGILYANSKGAPGALLGVTESIRFNNANTPGWYHLTFPAPVELSRGQYWIGIITGATGKVASERTTTVDGAELYNSNAYTSGPSDPFGKFTTGDEQMSLYATYVPVGPQLLGKTSVGKSSDALAADRKRANRYVLPVPGSVTKLSVYLAPTGNSGEQVLEGVIYSDSGGQPNALLGITQPLRFKKTQAPGWYDLPLSSPLKLASGAYWIGIFSGATGKVAGFRYDSVSGSRVYNSDLFVSGPSDPFGRFSTDDERMSLYATYVSE
jgi:uncharacterized repeat protein (TIGR01451 family)